MVLDRTTDSEDETRQVAKEFSQKLNSGDVVALFGGLGSGKTAFVKGIGEALDIQQPVQSPTFVILHEYTGARNGQRIQIRHFDLYRLEKTQDLDELGLDELLWNPAYLCLIEWAERIETKLRHRVWRLQFANLGDNRRSIRAEWLA